MLNYPNRVLEMAYTEDVKIIPLNWCPQKFFTFSFEGWDGVSFTAQEVER